MEEMLILVDSNDESIGTEGKMSVHRKGLLHRAFSIFLFDSLGRMLLQRRAADKYHSGGLWTNSCCGHPRDGEETQAAASRRLYEEMGIRCSLHWAASTTYRAEVPGNLIEHEFDHIYIGRFDGEPKINTQEASDWCWVGVSNLFQEVERHPFRYTVWFREILSSAGPDQVSRWSQSGL